MEQRLEALCKLGFDKVLIQVGSYAGATLTPKQCHLAERTAERVGIRCQGWGWVKPHQAPDRFGNSYHHWWLGGEAPIFDLEGARTWRRQGEAIRRYSAVGHITSFDRMNLHLHVVPNQGRPGMYYRQLYSVGQDLSPNPNWSRLGWIQVPVLPVFDRHGSRLAQLGPTMPAEAMQLPAEGEVSCWSDATLLTSKNTVRPEQRERLKALL